MVSSNVRLRVKSCLITCFISQVNITGRPAFIREELSESRGLCQAQLDMVTRDSRNCSRVAILVKIWT